jgi:hypothetical protein
LGSEI